MLPLPTQLPSPISRSESATTRSGSLASPSHVRRPSIITEANVLENAYGIPTLPVPPHGDGGQGLQGLTSKLTRAASHGRSISHPFPSLFSSKKKHTGGAAGTAGFESTNDDSVIRDPVRNAPPKTGSKSSKLPDRDLTTGKCMTCDSMVRWPKELKVFRCTVCLTINDLKPVVLEARRVDGHRTPVTLRAGTYPGTINPQKVAPISLERTRQLIDQCITSYFVARLQHSEEEASNPASTFPDLPNVESKGKRPDTSYAVEQGMPQAHAETLLTYPCSRSVYRTDERTVSGELPRGRSLLPHSRSSPGNHFESSLTQGDHEFHKTGAHGDEFRKRRPSDDGLIENKVLALEMRTSTTRNHFKPLEDYLITSFGSFECINSSFMTLRPGITPRTASEGSKRILVPALAEKDSRSETPMSELDAKTLLLGDFAENGSWWTGSRTKVKSPERSRLYRTIGNEGANEHPNYVTLKSPRIDWTELNEWYFLVLHSGRSWRRKLDDLAASELYTQRLRRPSDQERGEIEDQIIKTQTHVQRVLLKVTESLLKRPGRPLNEPSDIRFLLIILANPLLYPSHTALLSGGQSRSGSRSREGILPDNTAFCSSALSSNVSRGSTGQHSGIIKRVLGLLSNVSNECHHHLVAWFARFSDGHFQRTTDLIGSFVTYRLTRQHGKRRGVSDHLHAGLIPSITEPRSGRDNSAALHAALGVAGQAVKKSDRKPPTVVYNDDWQIKAAARVMALLFSANNSGQARKSDTRPLAAIEMGHSAGLAARERARIHGQILATSDFYNTLLDYSDLVADFEAWEARRGKFSFCQYPFFLSIWAKIQIMEHDARRQMEVKAREAFFDSIMTHKNVNQYLVLRIRRECLVEDSLKGVSEVVGTGDEEIKKGLRIEFKGEEGIDAGGLRKEWFLLLVREVFNPEHGMFTYDEDSHFCYFNPNSFETTDQFFLVGVVLGLAIYNSTILDVALPPFAFRKLLAAGPAVAPGTTSHCKPSMTYSLEDLAEYRPALASGLRQLLEFEGDVESTFCRDFVADVERYGQPAQVPLCPEGQTKPVTNSNRREFVDLYVRYLLDTAVTRQFEPFKRGFFTVCGGNALSLFRPEEIELLIRGSDEPLDIASLRAVSVCENWGVQSASETEPIIQWFWESFQDAHPKNQRKLLSFITGSDRIPAMGATNLVIKLAYAGNDCSRFPVARTCFNMLSLWRYASREKLETMLWRAVHESEGFGLK